MNLRIERNHSLCTVNTNTHVIHPTKRYVRYDVSFRYESPYHYKYEFYYEYDTAHAHADDGVYHSRDNIHFWLVQHEQDHSHEPFICEVDPSKGYPTLHELLTHDLISNVDIFESDEETECIALYTTNHTTHLQPITMDLAENIAAMIPDATESDRTSLPRFQEDMYSRGTYRVNEEGVAFIETKTYAPVYVPNDAPVKTGEVTDGMDVLVEYDMDSL